ncbi:oxidoreductase [Streptosporangium sp. NPDC051022]|uniref:oxidoreductase n=1 Tax=Streptosporangium sp. NPDC051022 TaxID=3155752 RepID=UPI003447C671
MQRVALVTGASSGIGAAAARRLKDAGFVVYAAARRVDRMSSLKETGIEVLSLDVTDEASVSAAVKTIAERSGRLDVLVNNAGYGSYGAIECTPLDEARNQFEVNLFGLARLTQLLLPLMREQGGGTIINVSSMGGKLVSPLGGWYHASKYAVEALSDALRMETAPFGIRVVIVEPGSIRTQWGTIAADHVRSSARSTPYEGMADQVAMNLAASSEPTARTASDPDVVGLAIARIAQTRRPRTRYRVGLGATPMVFLRWLLPDRAFDSLVRRAFGVHRMTAPPRPGSAQDTPTREDHP